MKTISSTTDSRANAVSSSRLSSTRCDHRARTDDPIWGRVAPASAENRCAHGVVRSPSTASIIATRPALNSPAASGSTRLWPRRSISRACTIANAALATRNEAETAPACE
jgi:hypothetical protein